jgi:hypothetical protein
MSSSTKVSYVAKDDHTLVCHIVPERSFQAASLCGRIAPKRTGGWVFIAETQNVIPKPPYVICASCEASIEAHQLHAR